MITYQAKRKYWYPAFYLSEQKPHYHDLLKQAGYSQRGYYAGAEITVRVDILKNWITTAPEIVTLNATYKGFDFQRSYGRMFSERGIALICARFIRDIKAKKIVM